MNLQEIIKIYIDECLKTKRCLGYFQTLFIYFAERPITRANITKWIVDGLNKRLEKPYAAWTIYTKLSLFRAAYMYCEQCGYITAAENPFVGYVMPPQLKNMFKQSRDKEYKPVVVEHEIFEKFLFKFLAIRQFFIANKSIILIFD